MCHFPPNSLYEAGAKLSTCKPIHYMSSYDGHWTPLQKDNSALKAYLGVLAISVLVVQTPNSKKSACSSTPQLSTTDNIRGRGLVPDLSRIVPTKQHTEHLTSACHQCPGRFSHALHAIIPLLHCLLSNVSPVEPTRPRFKARLSPLCPWPLTPCLSYLRRGRRNTPLLRFCRHALDATLLYSSITMR